MTDFTLTLSEDDMHVLNAALIEIPYRVAQPLITKINEQIVAAHQPPPSQPLTVDVPPEIKSLDQRLDP